MDTEYILDCSLQLAETTPLEYTVLASPRGAYQEVRGYVDGNRDMPEHFLQNTAGHYLDHVDEMERYYFALASVPAQTVGFNAFREFAEHMVQSKVQRDLGIVVPAPALAGLEAPRDPLSQAGQLVRHNSDINEGLVRHILETGCGDLAQRWSRDLNLLANAADWHRADEGQTFNAMLASGTMRVDRKVATPTVMALAVQAQQARVRREQAAAGERLSTAKRAIRKATRLFQSLGQQKNLQLIVSGQDVTLSHPDSSFKFVVRPPEVKGWLIDRTMHGRSHTPYEIQLLTKDDVYLARLCVYFDKTPALDQLLALTMFVQAGDELLILEKANWFGLTDWSPAKAERVTSVYPQLARKFRQTLSAPEDNDALTAALSRVGFAGRTHWEPYKGRAEQWIATWMEPARLAYERLVGQLQPVQVQLEAVRELERERERQARLSIRRLELGLGQGQAVA